MPPLGKPAEVLAASGRRLHRAPDQQRQPLVGGEPLPRPDWLGAGACVVWDELAPGTPSQGIDRKLFGDRLARYCERVARWRELNAFLHGQAKDESGCPSGYTFSKDGDEVRRPQLAEWTQLADLLANDEKDLYRVGVITTIPKDRQPEADSGAFQIGKYA